MGQESDSLYVKAEEIKRDSAIKISKAGTIIFQCYQADIQD